MTAPPRNRTRLIRVPQPALNELLEAGQRCSNICRNLVQQHKDEANRLHSMREALERWDLAVRRYYEARK